jgi:hypothetical protein
MRMLRFLDGLEAQGVTSLNRAIRESLKGLRGKAVFIILSDFLDPDGYEEGLKLLNARGYETFVFHILSEEEISPPVSGSLKLIDSETGETIELDDIDDILIGYRETLRKFLEEIESFCLDHSIEYIRASSSIPIEKVVLYYMRLGGWLK